MIGHQQIIAARRKKLKPTAVWIEVDEPILHHHKVCFDFEHPERALQYGFYPTIYMTNAECATKSLWFLVGCVVHVACPVFTPQVDLMIGQLACLASLLVCFEKYGDEIQVCVDGEWIA